jgi:hypothetical protein
LDVSRFNFDPLDPDEDLTDHPALSAPTVAAGASPPLADLISLACRRLSGYLFQVGFQVLP